MLENTSITVEGDTTNITEQDILVTSDGVEMTLNNDGTLIENVTTLHRVAMLDLSQDLNNSETTDGQVEEQGSIVVTETLSSAEVIERFESMLTEEQVTDLTSPIAGPLTTEEVEELQVEDPRGNEARLSARENTLIDEVMSRPASLNSPGFILTDDTE